MSSANRFSLIDPARSRVYYGYVILFIGTLGVWCSIPGQTIGVSVFTDPVMNALGLSRDQFSNAYALGTICSSFFITRAGRWFDRFGARMVAFLATLMLAVSVFLCSQAAAMSSFIKQLLNTETVAVPFALMLVLFFMIRFSGQGVLTMSSRNMIMMWFDKNRGKANAFTSVALSFGFSSAPLWLNELVEGQGWQRAWQYMAAGLVLFSLVLLQLYRNRPEDHGLQVDGTPSEAASSKTKTQRDFLELKRPFTLEEAKRTRAFWMYGLLLAFHSFFITGLTFHVVSIFESAGYEKSLAISLFLPASVVSVCFSTLFNFLSDYLRLKGFLFAMIAGGLMGSTGLFYLHTPWGVPVLTVGIGIMGGFFAVLNSVSWPRFFGRKHLGAIAGKVTSFLVLGSALAPSAFSYGYSQLGSYRYLGLLAAGYLVVLLFGSIRANNPQQSAS